MHIYDDDDDGCILDLSPPMTARRRRLLNERRAKLRPAYERLARQRLGPGMSQEAIDEETEALIGGGRIPPERQAALEGAATLGVPIADYDRLFERFYLRVLNALRFANLAQRLRLIGLMGELEERMQGIPASSPAMRDAEALRELLRRRIRDLAW